jgi:hypothetical protein
MKLGQRSRMRRLEIIVAVVVVLGFLGVISPPVGLAQPRGNIELKIRQAGTPADHQSLAALYEQEAKAANQLATKNFLMRDVLAAARAVQQKDRAGEHRAFVAKKYQEMAKEYETLAAIHKMMAEQRK